MRPIQSILFFPFILICLALATVEFFPAILWTLKHFAVYKWTGVGSGAYFLLRLLPCIKKNEGFMQTFSHELTHTIVGLMFGRKIYSFKATNGDGGEMWHSGGRFGDMFISLAPYCLPIFTYAFLVLRIIGAWKLLLWFDILIGFTLAFHIVCFARQTRNYQTDISSQGYLKSYLFIVLFGLFNATIILLSIRKGIVNSVTYLLSQYWQDIVITWGYVFCNRPKNGANLFFGSEFSFFAWFLVVWEHLCDFFVALSVNSIQYVCQVLLRIQIIEL